MSQDPKQKIILAIDDEEDVLEAVKDALQDEGFIVLTASNGVQGLEIARTHKPDLIILDLMMPQMDGFQVLQRLNFDPNLKTMPTIMLTGHGAMDNIFTAQKCRATDFLIKPFSMSELLDVIHRYV